jgi:Tol biopolymer transport system component
MGTKPINLLNFIAKLFIITTIYISINGCTNNIRPKDHQNLLSNGSEEEYIVFFSDRTGRDQLYIMPVLNGRPKSELAEPLNMNFSIQGIKITDLKWSPAIKKWFFIGISSNNADLYSANWDWTEIENITNSPSVFEGDYAISPNGKYIAYSSSENGLNTKIVIYDIKQQRAHLLTSNPYYETSPIWAEDNSHILFLSSIEGTPNIFLANTSDGTMENISNPWVIVHPLYSRLRGTI